MNQRTKSRKRNVVSGNVSQIKRQDEGLGIGSVGERADFITKLIRRRKDSKDNG